MNQHLLESSLRISRGFLALGVLACLLGAAGCNDADPIPAKHILDKDKPILVLVEGTENPAEFEPVADEMALVISSDLSEHKLATVVDYKKLLDLKASESKLGNLSVAAIGKRCGAGQVLYVALNRAKVEIPPGNDVYIADFDLRVSLIDVKTGRPIWPPDIGSGGYAMHPDMGMVRDAPDIDKAGVRSANLKDIGDQITRLFYEYTPGNGDD